MDSQWLKVQFTAHPDKSKAGLAAAIGLDPPAISKILGGGRQIKAQEYILMRKFFGLPIDGEAALNKPRSFSVLPASGQTLGDGSPLPPDWDIPAGILAQQGQLEKMRIFQVRENLMEPDFKEGEQVLVDISDRTPAPSGIFLISDGYNNMLRHCEKATQEQIKISAHKSGFQAQVLKAGDFLIVGRVIAKLQML